MIFSHSNKIPCVKVVESELILSCTINTSKLNDSKPINSSLIVKRFHKLILFDVHSLFFLYVYPNNSISWQFSHDPHKTSHNKNVKIPTKQKLNILQGRLQILFAIGKFFL